MKLLYFYFDFTRNGKNPQGYRGYTICELNFGTSYRYHIESPASENAPYRLAQTEWLDGEKIEPGFWGDKRIYNISALVGDNGAGKSMLIHEMIRCMMTSFHERIAFENLDDPTYPFAFLTEDINGSQSLVCSGIEVEHEGQDFRTVPIPGNVSQTKQFHLNWGTDPQRPRKEYGILRKTKMIYFSNALTPSDKTQYDYWNYYEIPTFSDYFVNIQYFSPLYDCSLIADMSEAVKISRTNEDTMSNHLDTYFNFRSYQEARYVFDRNQRKILLELREQHHLPVPLPKELNLTVLNPFRISDIDFDAHTSGKKQRFFTFYSNQTFSSKAQRLVAVLSMNSLLAYCSCAGISFIHCFWKPFSFDKAWPSNALFEKMLKRFEDEYTSINSSEYYRVCKNFILFLWRNIQTIEQFFQTESADLERKGSVTSKIQLGNTIDPCLEEFMIQFINFGRAVSKNHYFIIYNWALSSGESNLLHMFTKIRSALVGNLYDKEDVQQAAENTPMDNFRFRSREEKLLTTTDCKTTHDCDSVILFFDEADLTYHPEWQRLFITIITEFLSKVFPNPYYPGSISGCKSIQIILSTHSPLILGDFPSASVTYLKKNGNGFCQANQSLQLTTFGENLYTILKDGFYLQNGTIGEFARRKIRQVLKDTSRIQEYANRKPAFSNWTNDDFEKELRRLDEHKRQTVQYLAHGIIRNKLNEEIDKCRRILYTVQQKELPKSVQESDMQMRICQLEQEKKLLEKQINALRTKEAASK